MKYRYNKELTSEWRKKQRMLDTQYAQNQREAKRTEEYKARRRKKRMSPENREKERLYAREYRNRPEVKGKIRARRAANLALQDGRLVRPDNCPLCGVMDSPLADGRTRLRMDHHMGYDEENWLNVVFICVTCDGKQMRGKNYINSDMRIRALEELEQGRFTHE